MTDQQLRDAIRADPQAKALADAGDDSDCAARMIAILPPVVIPRFVTERGIYDAFVNPADALAFMAGLQGYAAAGQPSSPIVAKTLEWMSPSEGGVDVGNTAVRSMLDQLAAGGVLAPASVATVKALAESPAVVTPADVSRVWLQYRPDGQITGQPS